MLELPLARLPVSPDEYWNWTEVQEHLQDQGKLIKRLAQ
jgi:hypothetical protein